MKTMTVILIAPLLLLLGSGTAAEARTPFEQRCERDMQPQIEVSSHQAGFSVTNTVSSHVLNNRNAKNGPSDLMLGMTSRQLRSEIVFDGPALQDRAAGRECIAPKVSVDLSYRPIEVYVAREFHPASCSYREVFAHEMRHLQVYREQLPRIERLVRSELAAHYAGRPIYAPPGQGLDALERDVDGWLRPLIKAEFDRVEGMQAALDSNEETFRLSHACGGELATRMGSSF